MQPPVVDDILVLDVNRASLKPRPLPAASGQWAGRLYYSAPYTIFMLASCTLKLAIDHTCIGAMCSKSSKFGPVEYDQVCAPDRIIDKAMMWQDSRPQHARALIVAA